MWLKGGGRLGCVRLIAEVQGCWLMWRGRGGGGGGGRGRMVRGGGDRR